MMNRHFIQGVIHSRSHPKMFTIRNKFTKEFGCT